MIKINSKAQLESVIKGENISIVKLGTDWCFNCRSVHRVLESNELNYPKFSFYWIDLDKLDIGDKYKIEELPTVIAFKKGKEISRKNEAEVVDWLNFLNLNW